MTPVARDGHRSRERGAKRPGRSQPPVQASAEPQNRSEGVHSAEDLHLACDALVQRTRVKLKVDGMDTIQQLPSLLEQLADPGIMNTNGGVNGAQSRPPINTGIVGLLTAIAATSRRQLADLATADHGTDMARNVRAATTATIVTADASEWDAWLYVLNGWRLSARRELGLDSGRRQWLRGIACPQCLSVTALTRDRGDGPRMQTPALAVTWTEPLDGQEHSHEWRWEAIDCRSCGASWWRGQNLHHLIAALQEAGVIGSQWSQVLA